MVSDYNKLHRGQLTKCEKSYAINAMDNLTEQIWSLPHRLMVLTLERKAFLSNFATSIIAQFHLSLLSPESNGKTEDGKPKRIWTKQNCMQRISEWGRSLVITAETSRWPIISYTDNYLLHILQYSAPHENASSGRTLPKDKAEKLRSPTTMPVSSSTLDTIQGDFTA